LALWNGKDPIIKERLFGLTNSESNHGQDVKEYYFYPDSTPTHSYMKYLYKYPQGEFQYGNLVQTSRTGIVARGLHLFATTTAEHVLQLGKLAPGIEVQRARSEESVGAGAG